MTIADGKGNVIGKISQKFPFFKAKADLLSSNGTVEAVIEYQSNFFSLFSSIYLIRTAEGELIGSVEKQEVESNRYYGSLFTIRNNSGQKIAKCKYTSCKSYELALSDRNGKNMGKISFESTRHRN